MTAIALLAWGLALIVLLAWGGLVWAYPHVRWARRNRRIRGGWIEEPVASSIRIRIDGDGNVKSTRRTRSPYLGFGGKALRRAMEERSTRNADPVG